MGKETREQGRKQAESLYSHTRTFVESIIATGHAIPQEQVTTVVGFYLLWKGALQQNAAQQARKAGEWTWAKKLQKSATMHAVLALQTVPEVVEFTGEAIKPDELRHSFHRARLFGEKLAKSELAVRGEAGYTRPLNEIERKKLEKLLQKPPHAHFRRQHPAA